MLSKLKHGPTTALASPISVTPDAAAAAAAAPISSIPLNASTPILTLMSPAEQTMQRSQHPPPTSGPATHPLDPATHFQSPYLIGFLGCMFCSSVEHAFKACPQHSAPPGASSIFFRSCSHTSRTFSQESAFPCCDQNLPAPPPSSTPATQYLPHYCSCPRPPCWIPTAWTSTH